MVAQRLLIRLTLFYLVISGAVFAAVTIQPSLIDFLPMGGAQSLLTGPTDDPFESIEIGANRVADLGGSIFWLFIAVTGALLTTLPVTWTYMASRNLEEYDQALVETMVVLPIAVTAIVVMVHNSLALAFSLAGIVGGVRFRNTLKSSGDAIFILLAIGIGLAAGIGALEIAIVMTIMFNYTLLLLWVVDYGAHTGTHRYLRPRGDGLEGDEATEAPDRGSQAGRE